MDEIISRYTDNAAIEDGMLWPVSSIDRITDNLGRKLQAISRVGSLATVTYVRAVAGIWIEHFGNQARRTYDLNLDGGIWVGTLHLDDHGRWTRLEPNTRLQKDSHRAIRVWMIPNELGGLTLMLPEDY